MERHRQVKMLSIIALVIAIVGMSLGFAAFSTTLSISSSASVTPSSEDFKVVFSSSSTGAETDEIEYSGGMIATPPSNAKVSGGKISDIEITFTKPGESVLYEAYIYNAGKYDAYITDVNFGGKTCVADEGTTDSLVQKACDDIILTIGGTGFSVPVDYSGVFKNVLLKPGESRWIEIGIHYLDQGDFADGPFSIIFDDITINTGSVDNPEISFSFYDKYEEKTYNFKAAKGMKWQDWLDSDYNSDSDYMFSRYDEWIVTYSCGLKDTHAFDVIEDGREYVCE